MRPTTVPPSGSPPIVARHGPAAPRSTVRPTRPAARLREYLQVLRSILDEGTVDFHGAEFTAAPDWPVAVAGGSPIPLYVAAMGPKALQVTGELADGTLPYLAGPRTLEEFIIPTLTRAASAAGRADPATIAFVPALVTDDVAAGREHAAQTLAFYSTIPSYQRVIAREGVEAIADLAAVGDAETVAKHLRRHLDAGATDVAISPLDHDPAALARLWEVAAAL